MSTYAIGDIQGCFEPLQRLLQACQWRPESDHLWLTGDLVNRGPASLEVLRWASALKRRAISVLGNHDLHLLACADGLRTPGAQDTLGPILAAPDRDHLLEWLLAQPLLMHNSQYVMVHAGLLPQWTLDDALEWAAEVESALRGPRRAPLLKRYYEATHASWHDTRLDPLARLAVALQAFTRLRICDAVGTQLEGFTGPLSACPEGSWPWFAHPDRPKGTHTVVCGHWAALGHYKDSQLIALDSGCVWGRELTAIRLGDEKVFQVQS